MQFLQGAVLLPGIIAPRREHLSPAKNQINNFDFLRLLLAVVVIFSHSFALGTGRETNEPFSRLTHGQTTGGTIAVNSFFIMSGYLITASFLRRSSVLDYLGKRVRRIYPGFVASALFGALVIVPLAGGALSGGSFGNRCLNFFGNTLRLREFSELGAFALNPFPNAVNGSLWSIAYEFWCYIGVLILGVTGLLARRKLMSGIFVGSVLISIAFSVLHLNISGGWLGGIFGSVSGWARLLPMYLAGVVTYLYRDRIRYTPTLSLVCVLALLGACFLPFAWIALFPFAGAFLLFWIAFNPSIRAYRAGKFGDFSYGTYLYAFPVQQMIVNASGKPLNPFSLFFMATPVIMIIAIGSWYLVERPFLTNRDKPARNRQARTGDHSSASVKTA